MIKNLVVSGCSFTHDYDGKTWPSYLLDYIPGCKLYNMSFPGAGNFYIADTIRNCLINEKLDPAETLVLAMWSGMSRQDLIVDKEYYDMLPETCKVVYYSNHYVVCGGTNGSWHMTSNPASVLLKPLFDSYYKFTDIRGMVYNTLMHMTNARYFLEQNNYQYKFLSYVNYWKDTPEVINDRSIDYSLLYYANPKVFREIGNNWIWADNNKNCLYEYANQRDMLTDDGFHPNTNANKLFVDEILLPQLQEYLT